MSITRIIKSNGKMIKEKTIDEKLRDMKKQLSKVVSRKFGDNQDKRRA